MPAPVGPDPAQPEDADQWEWVDADEWEWDDDEEGRRRGHPLARLVLVLVIVLGLVGLLIVGIL